MEKNFKNDLKLVVAILIGVVAGAVVPFPLSLIAGAGAGFVYLGGAYFKNR